MNEIAHIKIYVENCDQGSDIKGGNVVVLGNTQGHL